MKKLKLNNFLLLCVRGVTNGVTIVQMSLVYIKILEFIAVGSAQAFKKKSLKLKRMLLFDIFKENAFEVVKNTRCTDIFKLDESENKWSIYKS